MYSSIIKRHLMSPYNGRKCGYYNGIGEVERSATCRTNPERIVKNRVKFSVCIDDGVILAARWDVFGDPVAVATASWCVQHIVDQKINDMIHLVTPERIAMDLEITDELDIRAGCATVIEALVRALDDYSTNIGD